MKIRKEERAENRSWISGLFDVSGNKGYKKFLFMLIMIDLTWFGSVVTDNLFGLNIGDYGEFMWTFFFALGLIIISDVNKVLHILRRGFKSDNFASLITFVFGIIALVISILSLPQINHDSHILLAVKGLLGIIAIVYTILEIFMVESEE